MTEPSLFWDSQLRLILLVIALTVASGVFDSFGFAHAANMWRAGSLMWTELAKSALGFVVGMLMYWGAVRYLGQAGIVTAELQTLLWFGITIVGVAVLRGRFFAWPASDQLVAFGVMAGLAWLLTRPGS
jgi:hypothetical protein